jgi:hypothetical protein
MLPIVNKPTFRAVVPFNWKIKVIKRKLKNNSTAVDSKLIKRKDAIRHITVTSKNSPLANNF